MALLETDPVDWALDEDGDLIIPIRYTRGLAAVRQGQLIRMRFVRGEWFANLDTGIRYMPNESVPARLALLGQRFNRARALQEYRDALLSTPGVTEILALDCGFDRSTRVLTVTWRTRTVWGDTPPELLEMEV